MGESINLKIGKKEMKTEKFKNLKAGSTFYILGDYMKIDQYEKTSDSYGVEVLTSSSRWFDEDVDVYID